MDFRPGVGFVRRSGGLLAPAARKPPAPALASPKLIDSKSGNLASGTVLTVNLPNYLLTDYIVLIVSRNVTDAAVAVPSGAVTVTELGQVGTRRLIAYRVAPGALGTASFTLTSTVTGVWQYWIASYRGPSLTASVAFAANAGGSVTTSPVAMPVASLSYITSGRELAIGAAGVNSTATWTTDSNTVFSTTANNAALMVDAKRPAGGMTAVTFPAMDRGLAGTARNQSSLVLVLQCAPVGKTNLLTNPSFELGGTLATSWQDEHATALAPTYSLVPSGVVDGALAQQIVYNGQPTDDGVNAKFEIFQAPVPGMGPGDVVEFGVWLSGSMTNVYAIIGVEAFDSSNVYISETDVSVLSLSNTPKKYIVDYRCPPGTDHVAVYLQCPGVAPTSAATIIMDAAYLTK